MSDAVGYVERFLSILGGLTTIIAIYAAIRTRFFSKLNWRRTFTAATNLLNTIEQDSWKPQIIVGLGRSGAIWAGWLAGNLGSLPVIVIDRQFRVDGNVRHLDLLGGTTLIRLLKRLHPSTRCILAVEGATSSGLPFLCFSDLLKKEWPECSVRFASIYVNKAAPVHVDYAGVRDLEPWPDEFPWHHRARYQRFIRTVPYKHH